jgi:hypothetical protein
MSDGGRIEIERCLGSELRIEFDDGGRLTSARTVGASLSMDPDGPSGRLSTEFGTSVWRSGAAEDNWSYGTYEQSETEEISLEDWIKRSLQILREHVVQAGAGELVEALNSWMSYVREHDIAVGRKEQRFVELYASTFSIDRPDDFISFARTVDFEQAPALRDALMQRIEVFSPTHQRKIRTALGLGKKKR